MSAINNLAIRLEEIYKGDYIDGVALLLELQDEGDLVKIRVGKHNTRYKLIQGVDVLEFKIPTISHFLYEELDNHEIKVGKDVYVRRSQHEENDPLYEQCLAMLTENPPVKYTKKNHPQ